MYFRRKLGKLLNGQGLKSARRYLRRALQKRRGPANFNAEAIMNTIDRSGFEAIRARYAIENPNEISLKYLDWRIWFETNLQRVRNLDLDRGERQSILDIGSGTGYFLYICRLLGHDVLGVDLDNKPMFSETTRLLGIERVTWSVQAFAPLPGFGRKFDAITAYMICFNNHRTANPWSVPEWDFFLDDLAKHLSPGGRVWLELNRERDGTCYTSELKELFESRGAEVVDRRVVFSSLLRAPSSSSPTVR